MENKTQNKTLNQTENKSNDSNFQADMTRKVNICDLVFMEICQRANEQGSDHFDSKDFYREYVMTNFEMKLEEFDKCLENLQTLGYIKITHHYRKNIEGEYSIPISIQVMEEGKKYSLVLQENLKNNGS
jgi:hypothetical protein